MARRKLTNKEIIDRGVPFKTITKKFKTVGQLKKEYKRLGIKLK